MRPSSTCQSEYSPAHRAASRRTAAWALGLVLASAWSCAPAEEPLVQGPIGAELSRPMPFSDVLGFVRLQPGGLLWERGTNLSSQVEDLAKGTGVEPLLRLLQVYMDPEVLREGTPLVVFFLDAAVHGFPFALAVQEQAGALERRIGQVDGVEASDDGRLLLLTRRTASGAMSMAMAFLEADVVGSVRRRDEEEVPAPAVYHRLQEDGYQLILPARDGRRNVRAAVERTRVFESLPGAEYVQLDLRRVLGGLSQATEMLFQSRFLQGQVFQMGGRHVRHWDSSYWLRRAFVRLAVRTLRECERIDYQVKDGEHQVHLRVDSGGLLSRIGRATPARPREELLAGVAQGAGVVALSLDGTPLLDVQRTVANALSQHHGGVQALPVSRAWWSLDLLPEARQHAFLGAREGSDGLAGGLIPWVEWWSQGIGLVVGGATAEDSRQAGPGPDAVASLAALLPWPVEQLPAGLLFSAETDPTRRQRLVRQANRLDPEPWAGSVPWPEEASALFRVDLGLVRLAGSVRADPEGFLVTVGPGRR